jgi:hypothetical protein
MDDYPLVYSARKLLETLRGPALMQVMVNPAELRLLVDSLDGIRGISDYLAETEQRIYPDQAPRTRNVKNNRVRVVINQPLLSPQETHESWVLAFVRRWTLKSQQGVTMRDIRNYNQSRWQEDTKLIVEGLVAKGELCKIVGKRTICYILPEGNN